MNRKDQTHTPSARKSSSFRCSISSGVCKGGSREADIIYVALMNMPQLAFAGVVTVQGVLKW